ncbi:MAG: class I SAM-dependent methyltransferase [Candidatus Omnitrophica bacterium]|nr:class I SAM-dependent methyltransferase [Candidatus Omnitrophota bacterium]
MRAHKDQITDAATKKAWEENWAEVDVAKILEIFSYPRVKRQVALFKEFLPKDKPILEGGCGLGPYVIYFRKHGYNLIGTDYNHSPLQKINAYDKTIPVFCSDVTRLPLADNSMGGYLSLGVIEHFTEGPEAAIQEAYRVLASQGSFIVVVPQRSILHLAKYPLQCLKRSTIVSRLCKKQQRQYYWEQYFKVKDLRKIFEKHGFIVIKVLPIDQDHSLVSFASCFRDKKSFDNANKTALWLSRTILERFFPWSTASGVVFFCRKA